MAQSTSNTSKEPAISTRRHAFRKPQLLDTNILSYPRTNPFHAINALQKLLGSLASRIGGRQYRLTPDEHKLSLHLLTIVEPFVWMPTSRRTTLMHQPTEILDAIVYHIDSKRDLLALALTCHRLYSVVVPRHYNYRVICAKASSLALWNHLIVNRALARNVRTLEIIDERSQKALVLPVDILKTDTDMESSGDELTLHSKQEKLLTCALTKMTTLHSFQWSCNHSAISIYNVWDALKKCKTLSQVTIKDNVMFSPYIPDETKPTGNATSMACSQVVQISNAWTSHMSIDVDRVNTSQQPTTFFSVLAGPLSVLSPSPISAVPPHTASNRLPSSLLRMPTSRSYISTSSTAETGTIISNTLVLPPNALPKLRELKCGRAMATAILSCPLDSPRPLEVLKGITLSGTDWDAPFFTSLRSCGSSVRHVELAGWHDLDDIRRLIECVPRLTLLDVSKHRGTHEGPEPRWMSPSPLRGARYNDTMQASSSRVPVVTGLGPVASVATNVAEWATVLAPLAELTTFVGVKFFYEVSSQTLATLASPVSSSLLSPSELSRVRKNDRVAGVLGNKCPKLRRLDHWEDAGGKVIVLSRDGGDVKWEVKRFKV